MTMTKKQFISLALNEAICYLGLVYKESDFRVYHKDNGVVKMKHSNQLSDDHVQRIYLEINFKDKHVKIVDDIYSYGTLETDRHTIHLNKNYE